MPCEWFGTPQEDNFHIADYLERQIEVDEQGLACNLEDLRAIIHDLTTVMHKLALLSFVKDGLDPEVYEDVVNLTTSAHALVCQGTEPEELVDLVDIDVSTPEAVCASQEEPPEDAHATWAESIHNRNPRYN